MKNVIKSGLVVLTALYISCSNVIAATPAELYDDVWKIVNQKYYVWRDNEYLMVNHYTFNELGQIIG